MRLGLFFVCSKFLVILKEIKYKFDCNVCIAYRIEYDRCDRLWVRYHWLEFFRDQVANRNRPRRLETIRTNCQRFQSHRTLKKK